MKTISLMTLWILFPFLALTLTSCKNKQKSSVVDKRSQSIKTTNQIETPDEKNDNQNSEDESTRKDDSNKRNEEYKENAYEIKDTDQKPTVITQLQEKSLPGDDVKLFQESKNYKEIYKSLSDIFILLKAEEMSSQAIEEVFQDIFKKINVRHSPEYKLYIYKNQFDSLHQNIIFGDLQEGDFDSEKFIKSFSELLIHHEFLFNYKSEEKVFITIFCFIIDKLMDMFLYVNSKTQNFLDELDASDFDLSSIEINVKKLNDIADSFSLCLVKYFDFYLQKLTVDTEREESIKFMNGLGFDIAKLIEFNKDKDIVMTNLKRLNEKIDQIKK